MVATNLKSQTKSLMDQRAAMEAEMNALIEALSGPGGPGLSGNLTDSEVKPCSLFPLFSNQSFSSPN
jgi:26S proteasome regulatory subunit N4